MNCYLKLNLQRICLVEIAATLWNLDDIRSLIANFKIKPYVKFSHYYYEKWEEIENKVKEKVSQLPHPKLLKEKILYFINPIGLEILRWMQYHDILSNFGIKLPDRFCWTSQGIIDRKKTAEVLIKDECMDVTGRFILACAYCIEDYISKLWNEIPSNVRESFCNNNFKKVVRTWILVKLVKHWILELKKDMGIRINTRLWGRCPYQCAFQYAAEAGNKVAAEYFLQKLNPKEKQKTLVKTAMSVVSKRINPELFFIPKKYYSDVLCFLLSNMDENQQQELFKNRPFEVLDCFLDWPWLNLFLEAASHVLDYLFEHWYYYLLIKISCKSKLGYKNYNYKALFQEFWQQSLDIHKKFATNQTGLFCKVLINLFEARDEDNLKLIFKNIAFVEKNKLIFKHQQFICRYLIDTEQYNLLKIVISECLPSNQEIAKFKTILAKSITLPYSEDAIRKEKEKWDKAFCVLDECACEYEKNMQKRM